MTSEKQDDFFLFGPDARQQKIARSLYEKVSELPIVSPHGHVAPCLFSKPDYQFSSPTSLLILSDHYIFRMLHSQGILLSDIGVKPLADEIYEKDDRIIWQRFAENFYLFRGTPTSLWLKQTLKEEFGIDQILDRQNAQQIYDQIQDKLTTAVMQPRSLYEKFKIEVLCTTDSAQDRLEDHKRIKSSGWSGKILPTFRPDELVKLDSPDWHNSIQMMEEVCGYGITSYQKFIQALEERRSEFKLLGAIASDHDALSPYTILLSPEEANHIFQRALRGKIEPQDANLFTAHMMMEFARMSIEDGLVMQWHIGSFRNHNIDLYSKFGKDIGGDIPVQVEFTRNLKPLLDKYGNDPRLRLILFTMDESNYARELAPLAGHYPAIRLGAPWWFHDSVNGIQRFLDQVIETAGLFNISGFIDDTRSFITIKARHDVWRRVCANWLAGNLLRGIITDFEAGEMIVDLSYRLAKNAYRLD